MELKHEKTEYIITDDNSENNAMLIGYLSGGIENIIKQLLNKKARTVTIVAIEDFENTLSYNSLDNAEQTAQGEFDWELCETLYLLKAYQEFTPKMKAVFNDFYIKDKPTSIIAAEQQCTQRAVNRILERCREYIEYHKRMEEKGNASNGYS